jgi:membrane protein implicated in regulation of membrane protease activity
MTEDQAENKRFKLFAVVRLFGVGLFLLGTAIAFTDLLKPGGWPLVGGVMAITGVLDAVFASRVVRRATERK